MPGIRCKEATCRHQYSKWRKAVHGGGVGYYCAADEVHMLGLPRRELETPEVVCATYEARESDEDKKEPQGG